MQFSGVVFCAASILAMVCVVQAASQRDSNECKESDPDRRIVGCTRVLKGGSETKSIRAFAYFNRGAAYLGKRDYDRAIADFSKVIRLEIKFAKAYVGRGDAYRSKGDNDRAIADYSEAIRLDPAAASAYRNRGFVYATKGDLDRAIADFNEAIQLDPKLAPTYANRGAAYLRKGDYDRAIADHSEAIRLDPTVAATRFARGIGYSVRGDFDRAVADYSEAIRLEPTRSRFYFDRARAYLYGGSLPKALADASQASELDPKNGYAALLLEIVGQRSGVRSRLSQAIAMIDMTAWPAPVIRMFMSQMTPAAVLAAADAPDAAKKKGQVCEANFYSGVLALRQNARDEAARLFRLAASDCPRNFTEWLDAGAELKALGEMH